MDSKKGKKTSGLARLCAFAAVFAVLLAVSAVAYIIAAAALFVVLRYAFGMDLFPAWTFAAISAAAILWLIEDLFDVSHRCKLRRRANRTNATAKRDKTAGDHRNVDGGN